MKVKTIFAAAAALLFAATDGSIGLVTLAALLRVSKPSSAPV